MAVAAGYPIIANEVLPQMTLITLPISNWSGTTQNVSVEGIKADETAQAIYINPAYDSTMIEEIASCNVYASAQSENNITFTCDTVPSIDLQFYVKWEDINYIAPPGPRLITFYIDYYSNEEFQAEEGMTWEDWVNSSYNEEILFDIYEVYDTYQNTLVMGVSCAPDYWVTDSLKSRYITSTDIIINGTTYGSDMNNQLAG